MKNIKKSKKKIKTKPKEKEKIVISTFSKIILENFKGYSKLTNIDLCSGVNLIYGKNSAGKSSIIQSLRFIRQNLLLLNASVPFIPISPVNMNLAGKIQFPEGIEGMIFAKDKKRELKLGVEIQSVSQNNQKINKRLLAHSYTVPKKSIDSRADLKSIEMKYEGTNDKGPLRNTDVKISLGKRNWFKSKSKIAKFLEDMADFSGPFNRSELGWKFDEESEAIIDTNYSFENGTIERFEASLVADLHESIHKNFKKNKIKILTYIEQNLLNIKKNKKSKKNQDAFLREMETKRTVVGNTGIANLYNFVKSPEFLNKDNFIKFFTQDIIKRAKLIRFNDQLIDKDGFEKLIQKEKKKAVKAFFIQPDSYLLNVLSNSMQEKTSFIPYFNFHTLYDQYLRIIRDNLSSILVIPGLRSLPERYHKRGVQSSFVGEQGENIGELIYNSKAKSRVNKWFKILEIPYEIRSTLRGDNYFYLELKPIGESYWISYRDVGLGYSLSLIFILTCLLESNKTILVEEPEVHLHPKLQGDIMDLLLYSAKKRKNQFIVETHSENMLLRAQKCIRKGYTELNPEKDKIVINQDDLGINNVYRENNTSSVQKIEIDNKGDFRTHWRDGFFSEKLDELF